MFESFLTLFAAGCRPSNFLGLVPWYKYLEVGPKDGNPCAVLNFQVLGSGSDIPLLLLALVDNLLRIAGLIAVIFVIYGGIMYATSQGSPDQTAKAQTTIISALAGLVIAIIAVTFVSFIGKQFN